MDEALKRLAADPAVAALVDGALVRAGGDAVRAADLLLLRLERRRPEDARARVAVLAEFLARTRAGSR